MLLIKKKKVSDIYFIEIINKCFFLQVSLSKYSNILLGFTLQLIIWKYESEIIKIIIIWQ
jgi:hypothetical protein